MASNLAAVIPSAKSPIEIKNVGVYTPTPNELLIKNTLIAFNPIEAKIAKLAVFPLNYPAILGYSYGGTVEAIGSDVSGFKIGDKVVVKRRREQRDSRYASFQQYAIATPDSATKLPGEVSLEDAVSVYINLATAVGMLSLNAGLNRPSLHGMTDSTSKKILVYGGSSHLGSLTVQYAITAGHEVVTTSSPQHHEFVASLGAIKVLDHTVSTDSLVAAMTEAGPFDVYADMISSPKTMEMVASVAAAHSAKKIFITNPRREDTVTPEEIEVIFQSYGHQYEDREDDAAWFKKFLVYGLSSKKIKPVAVKLIRGGIGAIPGVLDTMFKGVSGVKLVVHPWED